VFHRNYSPISYVSEIRFRDLLKKFHAFIFNVPAGGVEYEDFFEFCNGVGALKTRIRPLSECVKVWRYVHNCVKLLGILFQDNLKMDSRVHFLISQCSQRMYRYLLKLLQHQGPSNKLRVVAYTLSLYCALCMPPSLGRIHVCWAYLQGRCNV